MKRYLSIYILFLLSFFHQSLGAQVVLDESAKISLLTASAWHEEAYALFGHTAIRVKDDSLRLDEVYNYGYFDSTQPHFVYNFVRGKTDYVLGVTSFEHFIAEYDYKGQAVTEQVLALDSLEKQNLYEALYVNALPENMRYRYNYFYDNCATRPRDMIEKYKSGEIIYPATSKKQTFRDLIHECAEEHQWTKFGIDLVIGSEADKVIDVREKMYIPAYLMESFDGAVVEVNDTLSVPLVESREVLLNIDSEVNSAGEEGWLSPMAIAFALLIVTLIVSFVQYYSMNRSRVPKIYDTFLYGIYGIGGIIIFILMYFSSHPATNPNWNFAWLNIFALIAAILFWVKRANYAVYLYHLLNFAVLTLYLLFWWSIPQEMPKASIVFALSLCVRSGVNFMMQRQRNIVNDRFTSSRDMKAGWGQ
ncbi:MAG: DUF4105 domain-containing protein [Fermentimonas sp.]|jgi:hypothetical protein